VIRPHRLGSWRIWLWATLALGSGCSSDPSTGYSFTSTYRTDVQTIAVPIFDNTTFSHDLEVALTDAIVKEIHRSTPWRVTTIDQAQTTLDGAITRVDLRKLSRQSESGLVLEQAVEISVSFEWKRNTSGEVLVARRNFRSSDEFTPSQGAQERLELGERAAIDRLARDIVAELRSSW
jgi:hypothetical protein